jgi:hypothetical protein
MPAASSPRADRVPRDRLDRLAGTLGAPSTTPASRWPPGDGLPAGTAVLSLFRPAPAGLDGELRDLTGRDDPARAHERAGRSLDFTLRAADWAALRGSLGLRPPC